MAPFEALYGRRSRTSLCWVEPGESIILGPEIALPLNLANLHNVFHVSHLCKYIHDPSHVIESDDIQIKENLTYKTVPLRIDDKRVKRLRGKDIPLVKVVWGGNREESATWELESKMREAYPMLFTSGNFEDDISKKGGEL
ncbi:hypothetical protein Fmac_028454 [Flemingia macrophylla]|uniref:Chromo domain-containing protein n=1 Tax=Flemingia macrophylla TaxID=520843 RepID=A0ABD1L7J0_9FABA